MEEKQWILRKSLEIKRKQNTGTACFTMAYLKKQDSFHIMKDSLQSVKQQSLQEFFYTGWISFKSSERRSIDRGLEINPLIDL